MPDLTLLQMYIVFAVAFVCGVIVGAIGHMLYREDSDA